MINVVCLHVECHANIACTLHPHSWQFTHTEHQFEAIYGRCTIALEGTPPIFVMFVLPAGALLAAQR